MTTEAETAESKIVADGSELTPEMVTLIEKGKEQGYVTYDDILDVFPEAEDELLEAKSRTTRFIPVDGLEEIDLPPPAFLHLKCIQVGFLRAAGIYWSQVETFYVNAAPRLHRIEPFKIRVEGISASEDALYLGVDDGLAFREVRRQVALGVPKIGQVFKEAGVETGDADRFVPEIPFAYFSGRGDRARVIEAIAPHLDAQLGEYPVSHIKMGRVAPDPDIHYPNPDVVAEIILFGKDYRKGYHN